MATSAVYCASGAGANAANVLDQLLRERSIRGQLVLVKPNMVDPSTPDACSAAPRLQQVVDVLRRHGAGKVLLGDDPAKYVHDLAGGKLDLQAAYRSIGYDRISGAELIDLSMLPLANYGTALLDPHTAAPVPARIPIRDTTGMLVVNVSLPKQHGNFNYSGATKNLMGLVPPQERIASFHRQLGDFRDPDYLRQLQRFVDAYRGKDHDYAIDWSTPESLDELSLGAQLEHAMNAGALQGLRTYALRQGALHVMDGEHTMLRHEHDGEVVRTRFALASSDPLALDTVAMTRIGVDGSQVPYLCRFAPHRVVGDAGAPLAYRDVLGKEIFTDSHGLPFLRIPGP